MCACKLLLYKLYTLWGDGSVYKLLDPHKLEDLCSLYSTQVNDLMWACTAVTKVLVREREKGGFLKVQPDSLVK